MGSSKLKEISYPNSLPQVEFKNINKTINGEALGYTDKSNTTKKFLIIMIFRYFLLLFMMEEYYI